MVAIIAPLSAAILAFTGTLGDLPSAVIVDALATVGVGLLVAAIDASADVLARAWAVTANEHSSAGAIGTSAKIYAPSLSPDPLPVLTARWDADKKRTRYLVKEPGVNPVWVEEDKVES